MSEFNVRVSCTTFDGKMSSQQEAVSDYASVFDLHSYVHIVDALLEQEKTELIGISNLWCSKSQSSFTSTGAQSIFYGCRLNNKVYKMSLARQGVNFGLRALETLAQDIDELVLALSNYCQNFARVPKPEVYFKSLLKKAQDFARTKFVTSSVIMPFMPTQVVIITYNSKDELHKNIANLLKGQLLSHYGLVLLVQADNPGLLLCRNYIRNANQVASLCNLYDKFQLELKRNHEVMQQKFEYEKKQFNTELEAKQRHLDHLLEEGRELVQQGQALEQEKNKLQHELHSTRNSLAEREKKLEQALASIQNLRSQLETTQQELNSKLETTQRELNQAQKSLQRFLQQQEFYDLSELLDDLEVFLQQIETEVEK